MPADFEENKSTHSCNKTVTYSPLREQQKSVVLLCEYRFLTSGEFRFAPINKE